MFYMMTNTETTAATKTVFEVTFRGEVVGTYSTRKRARSAADRKDLAFGSYAHSVREVQVTA